MYTIAAHVQSSNVVVAFRRVEKDSQKQKTAFMQGATGIQEIGVKKYRDLVASVSRAVAGYGQTIVIMYLYAIAHLSQSEHLINYYY
jgi:hypothetical protein